ncbi:MAG: TIGR00282 family metallophosphoesterase [Clostridiales bacterium]|jgi:metallophosphoesterase (TIGR00282 family)|nr:TIGR00282 family metallophosphoesterase [Clostridiales bacterium]
MRVLALGDVSGRCGVACVEKFLRGVKAELSADAVVVNAENAALFGVTPQQANALLDAGADVLTLGNHAFKQKTITDFLDASDRIVRPANFAPSVPGRGVTYLPTSSGQLAVINLIGRCDMSFIPDNPFTVIDQLLCEVSQRTKFIVVDFHAEATSEKLAMAYHLDGRVSAIWGTHTHVQTADERVFPNGTGYISDLGMVGARESVIGVRAQDSVSYFLGDMMTRFQSADGPACFCGALFDLDDETGKCVSVERVRYDET